MNPENGSQLTTRLNSVDSTGSIKFTYEEENEGSIHVAG